MKIIKVNNETIIFIDSLKEIAKKDIPDNVLLYLDKHHNEKRLKESLNAWSALNRILLEYYHIDLKDEEIFVSQDNKPFIKKIHFNLSHSHQLIIGIISNLECGIDIEMVNHQKDLKALKQLLFNEEVDSDTFYQKWVQNEAYLKRMGTGIKNRKDLKKALLKNQVFEYYDEDDNKYYYSYDIL